jgi:ADP-glucose pyrophosphorylase
VGFLVLFTVQIANLVFSRARSVCLIEKYGKRILSAHLQKWQNFHHGLVSHSWWKEVEVGIYEERNGDKAQLYKPGI